MRAVIQRVSSARVEVEGDVTGAVDRGLLVLLGVGHEDGPGQAVWLAEKIANLRIFEDEAGKMNRSLVEVGGGALVVSQFTLFGDCRKGRRPSFVGAAPPERANELYRVFVDELRKHVLHVEEGVFQASMHVHLVNQGPVTILIDTQA